MLITLLKATLEKKDSIALISMNSKGRCLVLVKGIAKLCTLIFLSPSDDEYNKTLYINN